MSLKSAGLFPAVSTYHWRCIPVSINVTSTDGFSKGGFDVLAHILITAYRHASLSFQCVSGLSDASLSL